MIVFGMVGHMTQSIVEVASAVDDEIAVGVEEYPSPEFMPFLLQGEEVKGILKDTQSLQVSCRAEKGDSLLAQRAPSVWPQAVVATVAVGEERRMVLLTVSDASVSAILQEFVSYALRDSHAIEGNEGVVVVERRDINSHLNLVGGVNEIRARPCQTVNETGNLVDGIQRVSVERHGEDLLGEVGDLASHHGIGTIPVVAIHVGEDNNVVILAWRVHQELSGVALLAEEHTLSADEEVAHQHVLVDVLFCEIRITHNIIFFVKHTNNLISIIHYLFVAH